MTVDEALTGFADGWVDAQPVTPRTAYLRTLRLLRLYLADHPPALDADAALLDADCLRGFVAWHRAHALADTAEGSRKVAVSVRCGAAAYGTLLVTETRIVVGPLAERPFGLYWQLVKPASNMVRRSLLRAIARRAEAGTLS